MHTPNDYRVSRFSTNVAGEEQTLFRGKSIG